MDQIQATWFPAHITFLLARSSIISMGGSYLNNKNKCKSLAEFLELLLCEFRSIQFEMFMNMIMIFLFSVGLNLLPASGGFMLGLLFYHEDEGVMFIQHFGLSPN
jgi:hypothetical protein